MTLKITLHSNTCWGSAFGMLDHAYKLRAVSLHVRVMRATHNVTQGYWFIHLFCRSALWSHYGTAIQRPRPQKDPLDRLHLFWYWLGESVGCKDDPCSKLASFTSYADTWLRHLHIRIPIVFSIIFPPTNIQAYTVHFRHSRTSKAPGSLSLMICGSTFITPRSGMVSQKWWSIIVSLIRSRHIFSHW
jgi:hypothetical protein